MSSHRLPVLAVLMLIAATRVSAVSLGQFNVTQSENFDTLAIATDSVMPAGWAFSETGSSANTTYGAGTGSSTTGNTYSFGATGSTDRALGSLRTTGVAATFGTVVSNDTGGVISDLAIGYTGEQWRLGALDRVDRLDFSFSLDATSLTTGTWIDVDALDFVGPVTGDVTGALDGNALGNRQLLNFTISGLNLAAGTNLWIRWVDFDASGSDDGLAIDDFSITAPQTTTGGGGGETQNVPENMPTAVVFGAVALGLALGSKSQRIRFA